MIRVAASVLRQTAISRAQVLVMTEIRPVVISGPSGAGKSTLIKKLFDEYPDTFGFSVSHTTRQMRDGEVNGKQYHFVSVETMKREIDEGKFIEYTNFSGNYYGTSMAAIDAVAKTRKICILDVDAQGVKNIKKSDLDSIYIFIKPPTIEDLRKRLVSRGTETEESLERRMQTAVSAINYSEGEGVYDLVLINDNLDKAYKEFKDFLKQKCPIMADKATHYAHSLELPLAAKNLQVMTGMAAGDAMVLKENGFTEIQLDGGDSVAEIPLSPTKGFQESSNPAEITVTETPLLVMTDLPDKDFRDHSSSVVELEDPDATTTADGVCGKQSWCLIS